MKKLFVFVTMMLGSLVLLELGCYAYLRFIPSRFNPLSYYLAGMISNFHPLFHEEGGTPTHNYYPYVGFLNDGDWSKTKPPHATHPDGWVINQGVDKDGRQRYAVPEKAKGKIRVITFGGSTMAGMGQSSLDAYLSARLQARLNEAYPGKDFEVVSAAVYTYIAAEEMVLLTTKAINFQPDVILAMDGYNEFIRAYYFPDMPPFWGIFHEFLRRTYKRTQTFVGTASQLGYLLSKRFYFLAIPRALRYARRTHPAAVDLNVPGPARPDDRTPYQRALREYLMVHTTMLGTARAHGVPVILALQPNVMYKKPLSEDEKKVIAEWNKDKPRYSELVERFFSDADAAYDAFIRKHAGPGVQLYNLSHLFEKNPETLYVDSCHYNDRGADLIAAAFVPMVGKALNIRPSAAAASKMSQGIIESR